jgi:hypothetical protein
MKAAHRKSCAAFAPSAGSARRYQLSRPFTARPGWQAHHRPTMLLAAHESRREILGYQSRFMLPTVAPGQNYGSAPYRQLCPAYPFADRFPTKLHRDSSPRDRAKGSAGTFQRGKFPARLVLLHRKRISQKLYRRFPHNSARNQRHTASLDELAELNNYSKRKEISSTHLFASHELTWNDPAGPQLDHGVRASLLNPSPASTL